jgi:hypothetical protein
VLLRNPDIRDRDLRIFKPILKKGFESDPDLLDPNPLIPQKRSVTVVTIYAKRINAQFSGNFGCFVPGNKDSNPCLEDPDFLSPEKKGHKESDL